MSDLAFAAAAAGPQQAVPMDMCNQTQAAAAVQESPPAVHDNAYELPSVDDLEVAAAAAAAAMQAMHELHQDEGEETDEETSSSSSDEETESDSESESHDGDTDEQQQQPVALQLTTAPDGSIRIALQISQQQQQQQADVVMAARDADDDSSSGDEDDSSSSSSSSSESSSGDVESIDNDEMRGFINKAYAAAEDGNEAGGAVPTLEEDLGLDSAVDPLTDIRVPDDVELKQAGSIMSVLEGMVVVQGLANSRALDYGSVLLLGDKCPIGRVEEVFGPVTHPLYALRYAGPQPVSAGLAVDERVFYTDSLAALVQNDVYTVTKTAKEKKPAVDYEPEVDDDEPYFSDDEAEAEWRRSQGLTKRKHGADSSSSSGGRGRGRGRGKYGAAAGSSGGRGGPSVGFKAHATAGQLQGLGIQQDSNRRGGGRGRRGGRSGGNAADVNARQQQQQGAWQNAGGAYMGNGQQQQVQQMYPPGHPGGYGQQPMPPAGYMQPPQPPMGLGHAAGGVYVNPGMMQGPQHVMHMGHMQYPPQQQQQQPAGMPPGYVQPMPYGAYQWTGYGAPPPAQR